MTRFAHVIAAILVSSGAFAQTDGHITAPTQPPDGSDTDFGVTTSATVYIGQGDGSTLSWQNSKPIAKIENDGTVTFGAGFTPIEAADAAAMVMPMYDPCNDIWPMAENVDRSYSLMINLPIGGSGPTRSIGLRADHGGSVEWGGITPSPEARAFFERLASDLACKEPAK